MSQIAAERRRMEEAMEKTLEHGYMDADGNVHAPTGAFGDIALLVGVAVKEALMPRIDREGSGL